MVRQSNTTECLDCLKSAFSDYKAILFNVTGSLIRKTVDALAALQQSDEIIRKNFIQLMTIIQQTMPNRMAQSLTSVVQLLKSSEGAVRTIATKMIGDTLLYCFVKDKFKSSRKDLFKLVEARIYDKYLLCRKQAFQSITAVAPYALKILTLEEAVDFYVKLYENITDEKPSIRKEALVAIDKYTRLFHTKLYIGEDSKWESLFRTTQVIDGYKQELQALY